MAKELTLRRRIANSSALNAWAARIFANWLRLVRRTSSWEETGWEEVERAINERGACVMAVWHQRTFLAAFCTHSPASSMIQLHANARAGNLAGAILRDFGFNTVAMAKNKPLAAPLKRVLSGLKTGMSVGIAVDGPQGPARRAKSFPIQWARISRKPIVLFAAASSRAWYWRTWDRQMLPLPWGKVALAWRVWDQEVPAKLSEGDAELLCEALSASLDALTGEVDRQVQRKGAGKARP